MCGPPRWARVIEAPSRKGTLMAHRSARLTQFGRLLLSSASPSWAGRREGPHRLSYRLGMPRSTI
jgi:hypothetical protein